MASSTDPTLREQGFPPPDPVGGTHMPAGGGKWVTPHHLLFQNFLNYVSRTYHWTHDEALRDSACNARAMWADLVISTAIRDRQRPTVQLEWQLEPRQPTDPMEKQLADTLTEVLEEIPRFQQMRRCLLDALWWGRAGVQLRFAWDYSTGEKRMVVADWMPIHGDTLVFKFDGTIGYLVNSQMHGKPGVHRVEGRGGMAKFLTPDDAQCVLVHEFEPEPADYFSPEMAGSVHGSGYRGRVYWYWWLKHNMNRIMFDFLRKVGNGFFLAGYQAGNRTERENMGVVLEEQGGNPVIYVPLDQGRTLDEVLKHLPTNLSGADFQWTIIQGLNGLIRQAIMGEVGTTGAMSTGLSSDMGEQHGITADERTKYDAVDLETPMQKLVNVLAKYIAPGVRPPRFQHLADKRNPAEIMESATFFTQIGGMIPKTWLQEQLGIPEANEGEETLGMVQAQQPTAMNSVPAGVPMAGQPGPVGPGGQPASPEQQAMESQIQPDNSGGTLSI
jgi:phage gp29-like protein